MYIINIAAELAPIAKVGGLADVVLGLSRELSWDGHDVDIIIPKYDCMDADLVRDLHIERTDLKVSWEGLEYTNSIWMGWVENLKVYFIDPHHPKLFFSRGCIYACEDDNDRFLYFAKAALELIRHLGLKPNVLQLNDWHTAIAAPLYKIYYQKHGIEKCGLIYTIHNLEYQGIVAAHNIEKLDIALPLEPLRDLSNPENFNLMKGAILFADRVTTVSKTYAAEILTPEHGKGLNELLYENRHKLRGITNGIDYAYWNPETDKYLPTHYSLREEPRGDRDRATIDRKGFVKQSLRKRLMLDEKHRPIVGCVTRLVPQKGVELIRHALYKTLDLHGQFVLLGTTPIPSINKEFHELMKEFTDHPNVHIILKHEEEIAHLIFGGSDMFIVPSLFEPCGLTQLIAMKYGSVPIVRKTGGLSDTVFDVDHSQRPFEERNGYLFDQPTKEAFNEVLERAFKCWFEEPLRWRLIMENAMRADYSWRRPAKEYLALYAEVQ